MAQSGAAYVGSNVKWGGFEGETNGTSLVDIVPAPAAPVRARVVHFITTHNKHSAAVSFTIQKDKNGTKYILHEQASLGADQDHELPELAGAVYVLDDTDEKLQIFLGSSPASECDVTVSWHDEYLIEGN